MSRARKLFGTAVLLTLVLAACGIEGSTSSRVRNAAVECFNSQEEKDAAIFAAQAQVDAGVLNAQSGLDVAQNQWLWSVGELAPV